MPMIRCLCGSSNMGARFCGNCGRNLTTEQEKPFFQENSERVADMPQPKKKQEQILFNSNEHIYKEIAAIEVIKRLKLIRILAISSIIALFGTLLINIFNKIATYSFVGVCCVAISLLIFQTQKEIIKLSRNYPIQNKSQW